MRNLFDTPKLVDAQKRLNSVLNKLEDAVANLSEGNASDIEKLLLENNGLKEEVDALKQKQKEAELLKKKLAKKLDDIIKPLEDILNGNG